MLFQIKVESKMPLWVKNKSSILLQDINESWMLLWVVNGSRMQLWVRVESKMPLQVKNKSTMLLQVINESRMLLWVNLKLIFHYGLKTKVGCYYRLKQNQDAIIGYIRKLDDIMG